ncbi:hypothetical protein Gotur_026420 [Gossypium turneri]
METIIPMATNNNLCTQIQPLKTFRLGLDFCMEDLHKSTDKHRLGTHIELMIFIGL